VVKAILKDNLLLIAASDGFEHKVRVNEVVVIHNDNSVTYNMDKQSIKDKIKTPSLGKISSDILMRYTTNTKFQYEKIIEIDLHLEELVEYPLKLDDWQRL